MTIILVVRALPDCPPSQFAKCRKLGGKMLALRMTRRAGATKRLALAARSPAQGRGFAASAGTAADPEAAEKTNSLYFTTRDHIKGREVLEEFGMVSAVAVRSKSVVSDMYVALAGLIGGEAASYTSLMNETVAEAVHRVQYAAKEQGATAVINVRFDSNTTMNRLVFGMHCSVICYGTAVRCRQLRELPPTSSPFVSTESKQ